jgi:hypothetical protein
MIRMETPIIRVIFINNLLFGLGALRKYYVSDWKCIKRLLLPIFYSPRPEFKNPKLDIG